MSAHPPPPEGGRRRSVPILRIPSNRTRVVTFLGPYLGSVQHWSGKRTLLCHGDSKSCPHHRYETRYYGFAPAICWESATNLWLPVVVQLSSNLEQQLRGRVIRGETWGLTRQAHKFDRGPITGDFLTVQASEDLDPPFAVEPTLMTVYGVTWIPPHQDNPFPDRLILPPVTLQIEQPPQAIQPTTPPPANASMLQRFMDRVKQQDQGGNL